MSDSLSSRIPGLPIFSVHQTHTASAEARQQQDRTNWSMSRWRGLGPGCHTLLGTTRAPSFCSLSTWRGKQTRGQPDTCAQRRKNGKLPASDQTQKQQEIWSQKRKTNTSPSAFFLCQWFDELHMLLVKTPAKYAWFQG